MTPFEKMLEQSVERLIQATPTTFKIGTTSYLGLRHTSPELGMTMLDAGQTEDLEFQIKTTVTRWNNATLAVNESITVDPDGDNLACRVQKIAKAKSFITLTVRQVV